jgi:mono/diheme cytochrome c family protein
MTAPIVHWTKQPIFLEGELMRKSYWLAVLLAVPAAGQAQPPAVLNKVCGTCHPVETATSQRRNRAQWQESIDQMVARGAKGTPEEFAAVLDYLVRNHGPAAAPAAPAPGPPPGPGRGGRGSAAYSPGAADKHVVDPAAADRGRRVYAAECINCHGSHARGGERGADLIRSVVVLHDRYGSTIGPFLKKGHPTQTTPPAQLTQAQIEDLSHTIHQEVYNTLRSALQIQNVLTGDAKAGAVYFNGEGKCATCHSPTGDLKGIGARLDPPTLQQRFLFPPAARGGRGGRGGPGPAGPSRSQVMVTVTPASGAPVMGALVHMDDFNVSLRDSAGEYHSFKRTPALKVVKNDPLQAHHELLDKYTDKNMHDIVAYLETLK